MPCPGTKKKKSHNPGNPGEKKHREHTPYTSEVQTTAGNIALAAKKGDFPVSRLKGASRSMYEGMTLDELERHSAEAKGKDLPKRKFKYSKGSRK